ncbi:hypothetical protein Z969_10020 [Clostridium novyi A str. 4570]|uniref:HEPN domain-containing protein n=1 Tax=Clostridium novyi A str. 4570 TaxID=1444290 RepID=A0AA88ZKJ1_CLONO|nr:hypothetical protein [Clostridium novyi]KGN00178.1 hypothetical protein Z969_10020 [Clostridium novyi A str. 4570]
MFIGKVRHNINVSNEYEILATKDEEVALCLKKIKEYRHSIYFFVQAMEKYIRSKIFTLVNPNLDYFRKKNHNHSIDNAIEFLVEIISPDKNIQQQIKSQLDKYVLQDINFQKLHNNLRYPFYNLKNNSYSCIDFNKRDCEVIEKKLTDLKIYLNQLQRL